MNTSSGSSSSGSNLLRYRRLLSSAAILLSALLASLPLLVLGPSCGHDFDFHLASWFDAQHAWSLGLIWPHWASSFNYGAGQPLFVFYPPLSWMLGAALGAILPWPHVPFAVTLVLLAGTGFATRALAREFLPELPATLAGCFALFSAYVLFDAFERADFGELAGGLWIPLLLLYILRDRQPTARLLRRAFDGSAAPLACVVAAAWLSNAPLGVIACYLLAAMASALAIFRHSWASILRSSVAVLLGLGLAAIYLVPAAYEQRWVNIRSAIADPGEQIHTSWLFALHGDPALVSHNSVLVKVSLICVAMVALALAGIFLCIRRRVFANSTSRPPAGAWISLALIPPAILLLQLPLSAPLWNHLPKLAYLQFPWRWLIALAAPMALFCAEALWPALRSSRWPRLAAAALIACYIAVGLFLGFSNFHQPCDDQDAVAPMRATWSQRIGFQGEEEYAPRNTRSGLTAVGLPFACFNPDPEIPLGAYSTDDEIVEWDPSQHSCLATFSAAHPRSPEHLRLTATLPQPGYLILRLRRFPAWRILVNGQPPANLPARNDGLFAVPVSAGPVQLAIDWSTTPDAIAGRALTALALALLAALLVAERKSSRARLS